MRWILLTLVLSLGCSGLLPPSSVPVDQPPLPPEVRAQLCLEANQRYTTWHTVGIVFTAVGAGGTGGGIAADFATDEKWVGIGLDLFGIASAGIGFAGHLVADDAAGDVLRYCEESE